MIDLNPKHLATVQRILTEHVPKCEVRAFGSRVKWTAEDYSDLDLAVVGSEPLTLRQLRRLKEAFEESDLPIRVDVVDWQSLADWFKEVIAAEYEVIQKMELLKESSQIELNTVDQWQQTTLGEICNMRAGIVFPRILQGKRSGKYPFAKVSDMNLPENAICIWSTNNYIDEDDLSCLKGQPFPAGCTVFAKIGEGLKQNRLRFLVGPTIIDNNMMGAIPITERVDPRFFFYALSQFDFGRFAEGTALPYLTVDVLSALSFHLPPLSNQRAIAHILGTLDEKIELNRQMNQTLEAMARAIFKSWFVDFDPVQAKMEGRQPLGMDAATAALFPSAFQDSPLGKIPEEWEVGTVGEEFNLTMGQSPPGSTYNEDGDGLPFYQGRKDFGFRYPARRVYCNAPTRLAKKDDTLVSVRAPVGDINMVEEKCCIGRGVAAIRHKTGSRSYTYYAMQFLREDFALYEAEGTVFGAINKTGFQTLPQLRPSDGIIEAFEGVVYPLDQSIGNNESQSRTLSQIRDALLPKLLSGKVRVKQIEEQLNGSN